MVKNQIAEKITPIFLEIEQTLLANNKAIDDELVGNPNYSDEALRATLKMFMDVLLDKVYVKEKNRMGVEELGDRIIKMGKELRWFVRFYTGVDPYEMYKRKD